VLVVLILASLVGGRSLVANVADGGQHAVKPGETLSGIAAQYGLTVDQLVSLNGLADPDQLADGQTLRLPPVPARAPAASTGAPAPNGSGRAAAGPSPPAPGSGGQTAPASAPRSAASAGAPSEYVVQPGDTLSGIAKALGVSLKALLEANELADPDRLKVGQKLSVPAGAAPGPPEVPAPRSSQPGGPAPGATTASGSATVPAGASPDEAGAALDRLAQQYGVDPALARALAWIETDGKPRTPDAPGGIGYLAVTDRTFEHIQQTFVKRTLDRASSTDNLEAGIAYVAAMLKWGGDEAKGLAGFLQGPGSVRANGVRPAIEQEVKRILALRDRLKQGLPAPLPATTATPAAPGPGAGSGSSAPTAVTEPKTVPKTATGEGTASLTARAVGAARTVAGPDARIGISGRNLVSGQRLAVGADQTFPSASVGKLALLVEAYRECFGGAITLTEAQRADLRAMIVASDNDAANRLLGLLSARAVNANLQALGLVGTRLVNPFGLARTTGGPANVTTPADMTRLMELLATERLVSAQASREMRGLLLQSQDGSKLRRGLPADARVAHKSGWFDSVANDVGIISQGQSSYVLGVFTEGIADPETANQTIAAVAQVVHRSWGPPDPTMARAAR
jgi:LysM repeat protein/beta-lactamase class A